MSRLQGSRLQRSRVAADRSNPAKPIRVGIVGADPARGWVLAAHLPTLVQLSGFTVTAVSTTRQQSAEGTAARFSIPYAFHDAASLAASDDVDLAVVSVKVGRVATPVPAAAPNICSTCSSANT